MSCIINLNLLGELYRSQETAINSIDKDISLASCFCFAVDIVKNTGHKQFGIIPLNESRTLQDLSVLLEKDTHRYEWLIPTRHVKPYFDLEMEIVDLTLTESEILLSIFIRHMLRETNQIFNLTITDDDIITLSSSKIGKLSYHLVINSNIYFENTTKHSIFIKWLESRFITLKGITEYADDINKLTWLKNTLNGKTDTRFIFDTTPYSKEQKFRCINQSKKGSNRPLILSSKPLLFFTDSLVGLYGDVPEHYRLLNVEPLIIKESIVKKNRVIKSKTIDKTINETSVYDNDGYIIQGVALFDTLPNKYDDLQNMPKIEQYLNLIPNNPSQSYDIFNKIRHFYFHNGGKKADFVKWWRLSPCYDGDDKQLNIFRGVPDPKNNNMNFLKKCSYKSQPAFFITQSPLLDSYYTPKYPEYAETINEVCNFVSEEGTQYEDDIITDKDFILLNADMGSGKSVSIKRLINRTITTEVQYTHIEPFKINNTLIHDSDNEYDELELIEDDTVYNRPIHTTKKIITPEYQTVAVIAPRITYTKHVATEFGVDSYLDGKLDGDKIACSVESLYKLPKNKIYDLVILDESEAILSIFSSPTLSKNEIATFNKLVFIIQNAKKTVFAGAFITQKTVDFITSFKNKSLRVINHTKINVPKKYAVQVDSTIFNTLLMDYIRKGGKPYYYCNSKHQADEFIRELSGLAKHDPFFEDILKRMLYYSSTADDSNLDLLDNINESWSNASLVIATPSITVGNSYCPPQTTFTSVWINFYPSCIVADTFQGHKRVRFTTTNTLYYCLPTDKLLRFISSGRGEFIKSLKAFDDITTENRILAGQYAITQRDEIKQNLLLEVNKQVQWCNRYKTLPDIFNKLADSLSVNYVATPEALRKLLLFNANENVLSCLYFKSMVITFIARCGYTKITQNTGDKNQHAQNQVDLAKNAVPEDNDYSQIKTIDEEEYDVLVKEIKLKRCSFIQKQQVEKYVFDRHINPDLPDKNKQQYFKIWLDNQQKHFLTNLYKEANYTANDEFLQNIEPKKTTN